MKKVPDAQPGLSRSRGHARRSRSHNVGHGKRDRTEIIQSRAPAVPGPLQRATKPALQLRGPPGSYCPTQPHDHRVGPGTGEREPDASRRAQHQPSQHRDDPGAPDEDARRNGGNHSGQPSRSSSRASPTVPSTQPSIGHRPGSAPRGPDPGRGAETPSSGTSRRFRSPASTPA